MKQSGYVYLIQPCELVGIKNNNGDERFKIGRGADIKRPINGYKKNSHIFAIVYTKNIVKKEQRIKQRFNEKFKLIAGKEFFEGKRAIIRKTFLLCCLDEESDESEESDDDESEESDDEIDEDECLDKMKNNICSEFIADTYDILPKKDYSCLAKLDKVKWRSHTPIVHREFVNWIHEDYNNRKEDMMSKKELNIQLLKRVSDITVQGKRCYILRLKRQKND